MSKLSKLYADKIHITRSIDDQMSKLSKDWKRQPKKSRYNLIHLVMVSMLL
ncbi:hypothetical protein LCGC14_2031780 [marine sediment metagenome]|uniref:Uncharacterized protein n=1 Tax=marine sediment metagenome TaxID=412755 RepID=A0A0F9EUK6_9ZZZZ